MIPEECREALPREIRDLPIITQEEAVELIKDEMAMFAGRFVDADNFCIPNKISPIYSFAFVSADRARVQRERFGKYTDDHEWVAFVLPEEIKLMLEMEDAGKLLLFCISEYTLITGFLEDHLYYKGTHYLTDEPVAKFGFSAWEVNNLVPMFKDMVKLVWVSRREI